MTHSEELHAWIGQHMPDIAGDLACKNPTLFRARSTPSPEPMCAAATPSRTGARGFWLLYKT